MSADMLERSARIDHLKAGKQRRKVTDAATGLFSAITNAERVSSEFGPGDPRTLDAWEIVETLGAVIHRQSRLLCGKPRGG